MHSVRNEPLKLLKLKLFILSTVCRQRSRNPMAATALENLLAQALPAPSSIKPLDPTEGGAVLALALHCLMAENGFIALDAKGRPQLSPASKYRPPTNWNAWPSEWIFLYARRGAANRFRLHCAALPGTGRVFVHASELTWEDDAPLEGKICVLGLQLQNYVPDGAAGCVAHRWQGVLAHQDKLQALFQEHVLGILPEKAEPSPDGPQALPAPIRPWFGLAWSGGLGVGLKQLGLQERLVLVGAGLAVAAAGLAAVALRLRTAAR